MKLTRIAALLLAGVCISSGWGDEKYAPSAYWISRGYRPVLHTSREMGRPIWPAHSLKWPVPFQDAQHSLGNSMAEFQDYGDGPYYHGGCDLRVKEQQTLVSPISGKLEAGHYGYTNNPDGSSQKYWIPWPGDGDADYFEIAVVATVNDEQYRFEFHHIDADHLPDSIVAILKNGGGRVQAGQLLGQTVIWPSGDYNHTHLNIITPGGVQLNPEYYFELIADQTAPQIETALAVMGDQRVLDFGNGKFSERPSFFAVAVNDYQNQNVYVHPPVYAGVRFDSGESFTWDFRERLSGPDGKFPAIWSFFVQQLTDALSNPWITSGGYGDGLSVIQIPIPKDAKGPFVIELADEAGNPTQLTGTIELH